MRLTLTCPHAEEHRDAESPRFDPAYEDWQADYYVQRASRSEPACVELDGGDDRCPTCGAEGVLVDDPFAVTAGREDL